MINLLIADDEALERTALAKIVARSLPENEVTVRMAENGRQAAELAVQWPADLILMDIEMPGQSGLEAARAVLAKCPLCKIIFVTAYSLFHYAHEAVHLGASDYILKPVEAPAVEGALRRAINQIEVARKLSALAPQALPAARKEVAAEPDNENPQMASLMAHVGEYLANNYMNDVSLDSLGDLLKISPSYCSVLFKRYFHVNFLDYLTDLRIKAACELLHDPLRPTAEVAGMVGYEDANYFSKAFKKKTGMTPTLYRRQSAGKGGRG